MKPRFVAHDLVFEEMMDENAIRNRIVEMGRQIQADYSGKNPLFLGVLNGAFIFAADLIRASNIPCEIDFIRLTSYDGLASTGNIETTLEMKIDVKDRHVIIVEDIVDTGNTLTTFRRELGQAQPASIAIATLLMKPKSLQHDLKVEYIGFNIPPKFVIGCGLDYNEQGRHLRSIYQLIEQ